MNMAFKPASLSIRILERDDANELARIDAFVHAAPEGTPFHRPAWLQAVSKSCGHEWRYLLAEDSGGQLRGVLPLNLIHSALFGRALTSSGFAVGGGILADNDQAVQLLAEEAWRLARRGSFPSVELRGGPVPDGPWQCKEDVYAGFVTELADDAESQLLAIPRKQRAEIRKGLKNDLTVRIGTTRQDRDDHYAVYAESVRNLGTPVFPQALFDAVLDAFGTAADILTVLCDGAPVASVLSLYHRGTVMPYWGGGTWDARRVRANEIMYYELMNHARERGCTSFDFGRSKYGTGAFSFKKNWGFEPRPLSYATRTADGVDARDVNPMSPKYRMQVALWQQLPLWFANRLGPLIARGLG
ncbi:FemAB family XrtA/PEP-CTERM system-associated protein [Sphingorhabdus sp. 109]|jgi:FemAB-related protein (PEP-CTERM system-associated)|uniref:FemAB family XrtA/PEP-CTERM system-associated protein n=1 Tax=Sphingorhabdus sp. 109 TaxID=2653173 RepID=UPI0012F121F5|nr:FemAB family XrtA/PEP-CTERM system-associated protein [Sphingorhabdus sp. 109]VWX56907.1 Acetyltransferase (GNAT) domain protein [Sphingorhabdus sp. 109]